MTTDKRLWINAQWINRSTGYFCGETEPYETRYGLDERGKLFRALQREHGRCISKMYQDRSSGAMQVGWVFEKQARYEDTGDPYLQETWVAVWSDPPRKVPAHWEGGQFAFAGVKDATD